MSMDSNGDGEPRARLAAELAPHGRLRAAVNLSNAIWVSRSASGALTGLAPLIAEKLGAHIDTPVEIVAYDSAGVLFKDRDADRWDIGFLAADAERSSQLAFTPPIFSIEGCFLVADDADINGFATRNYEACTIGVSRGSAIDLFLSRRFAKANLVRSDTLDHALERFRRGEVDLAAGPRQPLQGFAMRNSGAGRLTPPFMRVDQACALPLDRQGVLSPVSSALRDIVASADVKAAIERATAES